MTYKIKNISEFLNEGYNSSIWRNTNYNWLLELLNKKQMKSKTGRFISFSLAEDSGGQDDFGGTRIKFNKSELDKQGLIEIYYEEDFFKKYQDISIYVTGFKNAEEYYDNRGYSGPDDANDNQDLTWDQYIEGYEEEQELVLKNLKFTSNLIEHVTFIKDKPNKKLLNLLEINNITYDI